MSPRISKPKKTKNQKINGRISPSSTDIRAKGVRFSLKYLREIDYFEWGDADANWHASFLKRLKELESHSWEEFSSNRSGISDQLYYHPIDWELSDILKRSDINWIPDVYMDDNEYPIYQFSVSQGKGRFHGFTDENGVFNILLIDLHHNLQPSQKHNYQTRPTHPCTTSIEHIHSCINTCDHANICPCKQDDSLSKNIILFKCDLDSLLLKLGIKDEIPPKNYADIFEEGINAFFSPTSDNNS